MVLQNHRQSTAARHQLSYSRFLASHEKVRQINKFYACRGSNVYEFKVQTSNKLHHPKHKSNESAAVVAFDPTVAYFLDRLRLEDKTMKRTITSSRTSYLQEFKYLSAYEHES